ncbi:hypothetical protein GCM10010510_35340 [Streptomyces anandii JCM 4720]|nr:hypothetical protein GCM10010510_35340 [Streptomyces anandii JCM 4720]
MGSLLLEWNAKRVPPKRADHAPRGAALGRTAYAAGRPAPRVRARGARGARGAVRAVRVRRAVRACGARARGAVRARGPRARGALTTAPPVRAPVPAVAACRRTCPAPQ